MRLLLGIVAFILCVLLSVFLASKYKDRKDFYNDFLSFNKLLIKEVGFGQKTLFNIIDEMKSNSVFLNKLKNKFYNKEINEDKSLLKKDEQTFFNEYVSNIGTSDKASQMEYLKSVSEYLQENLVITQEEYKKYNTLYIKMGILIGLIVLIIII